MQVIVRQCLFASVAKSARVLMSGIFGPFARVSSLAMNRWGAPSQAGSCIGFKPNRPSVLVQRSGSIAAPRSQNLAVTSAAASVIGAHSTGKGLW